MSRASDHADDGMGEPIDLRLFQANERTLLAWVRTGLALMAFGFVVARLGLWLQVEAHRDGGGVSLLVGAAVIGLGAACQVAGAVRFLLTRRALLARRPIEPGAIGPVIVALVVAMLGAVLLVHLLLQG